MQLQGLMFALFMLTIIPIMILSANHNAFFLIMAIILFTSCIKKFNSMLFLMPSVIEDEYDDINDDEEKELNLNVKKFGIGTRIVRYSIVILFFVYCAFYIYSSGLIIALFAVCFYWINKIIASLLSINTDNISNQDSKLTGLLELLVNSVSVMLIVLVAFNKFMGASF